MLCELLTVSDEHAFRGPLIVGGGLSPQCEVRWDFGVRNGGVPDVTVHSNGLVNLNGRTETFSRLTCHGGRVTTGQMSPSSAASPSTRVDCGISTALLKTWLGTDLQGRPPLTLNDGGDVQTSAGIFVLPVGGDIVVNPGSQRFGNSTIAGRIGLNAGTHRISVGRGGSSVLGGPECNLTAAISETGAAAKLEKDGGGTLRLAGTNNASRRHAGHWRHAPGRWRATPKRRPRLRRRTPARLGHGGLG